MKNFVLRIIQVACIGFISSTVSAQTIKPLPTVPLSVGLHQITAEFADTESKRNVGLMFREEMAINNGMLFKFDFPAVQCMWMRNTYIPLSVAFIDENGKILNIEDMEPKTENSHCAIAPAKYALEMNLGWFNKAGVKPGTVINGVTNASIK